MMNLKNNSQLRYDFKKLLWQNPLLGSDKHFFQNLQKRGIVVLSKIQKIARASLGATGINGLRQIIFAAIWQAFKY